MQFTQLNILLLVAGFVSLAVAALAPIEVKGNAFFNSETGDRFYIRGVDYQPGGESNFTDPLADVEGCRRDVPYFQKLGLNTIRVYSVDNSADHSECMSLLDKAGIYLILDVNTPQNSISRIQPYESYNAAYLQHVFSTIDVFANYTNTLGFFAANEVVNSENTTFTAPVVKAVVRDMKEYISKQAPRKIPVGYSAADVASNRYLLADYLNCGEENSTIDMLGVNDYSWCGQSSYIRSGWNEKVQAYAGYSKPIFLSEFGCNEVPGARPFTEIGTLYSTLMTGVFSGGLVYEYSEESSKYGLVTIDGDKAEPNADFDNLASAYSAATDPSGDGGYSSTGTLEACPTYEADVWDVKNDDLPALPERASIYMVSGAGQPLGTDVPSTQFGDPDDSDDEDSSDSSTITSDSSSSTSASSSSSSSTKETTSATSSQAAEETSEDAAPGQGYANPYSSTPLLMSIVSAVLGLGIFLI